MEPPAPEWDRSRVRRAAAVGASVLLHVAALAFLALNALSSSGLSPASPPAMEVELRGARRVSQAAEADAVSAPRARADLRVPQPAAPRPVMATPLAPVPPPISAAPSLAPAPAAGAPAASPSAGGGAAGVGGPGAADVRGALRGLLGCSGGDLMRLSPGERARCDQRLGEVARSAPRVDPIPAEKRAYYDAVAAAYAKVRDTGGTPGRMPVGPPGTARGQVSFYIPGVGCGMKFGIPRGWKSYHDRPPHSLKLGPLPCFVTPPQALGTEESGVEQPASLRERTDDAAHMKALEAPPHA